MIDFDPNTADPIEYICNAGKAIYFLFCLDHSDYYEDGSMPNISDVRVDIQNSVYRFNMELKSCLQNIVNNKYFNVFLADNAKFLITEELDAGKGESFFRSLFCSEDERVCALSFALWLSSECIMPDSDDEDSDDEDSEEKDGEKDNIPKNLISIVDKM